MGPHNSYLLKLAWKNIRRNAGRSLFIGLSVSFSVTMAVWILAFFDGLNHQIETSVAMGNVGLYQLQENHFARTTDPFSPRAFDSSLQASLAKNNLLKASPELLLDGYLSAPEGSAALQMIGVDFVAHARLFGLDQAMTKGHWPQAGERGVVIGQQIAEKFRFTAGDQLVVNFQDFRGELKSELLPILGIYHKNGGSFERRHAYLDANIVEEFLFGESDPRFLIHRVVLMPKDLPSGQAPVEQVAKVNDLKARSWKDLNPEMGVILDFHGAMMKLFMLIVGITITVTILTPVSMLWQERAPEIRMMSTIGVPPPHIWRLGLYEAGVMTFLSGGVASLLLILIIAWQSHSGISFEAFMQGEVMERAGIEMPKIIYPLLLPSQILIAYGFVLVVMGLSYAWGVSRVLRHVARGP